VDAGGSTGVGDGGVRTGFFALLFVVLWGGRVGDMCLLRPLVAVLVTS
jgi:hypothetical protein